jgi:hypothetical protein
LSGSESASADARFEMTGSARIDEALELVEEQQ